MTGHTPPTNQQLDEYEAAARNAARIGSGIDPTAVLELAAEVRRLRAQQPAAPLTEATMSGLLAHHAGQLAATFRLYLSNELPEHRAGMERAVGLLDLHREQLAAGRWTDDVQRMLAAMVSTLTDEGAASMRRDGFGVDEITEILARPVIPAVVETGEAEA